MSTSTVVKSRREAQPVGVLMELDPAVLVYRGLSADRRELFHKNRRILVVDDMESTCSRLQRQLSVIYPESEGNVVKSMTHPLAARDEIIRAKKSGRPYDAIVLDLFMEGLQGVQLMKDIHERGAFSPVVVNTASMMDSVVSDTVKQFDRFRTRKAMESWLNRQKQHIPRPILFHDKFDQDLNSLACMMDVAMLAGRKGFGDAGEFLREFNPMLVPENFTSEVAHKIVEETRNCVGEVREVMELINRKFPGFKDTPWWNANGRTLASSLKYLGGVSFRNTYGETPKETGDKLHIIANRMVFIKGPDAEHLEQAGVGEYAKDTAFIKAVGRWNKTVAGPYAFVSRLFSGFREYHKPEVNVPVFVREVVGGAGSVETQYENLVVRGEKNVLQDLIRVPVQVAKKRAGEHPGGSVKVRIDYARDIRDTDIIDGNERARLEKMKCKRCCVVDVSDNAPTPTSVDKLFGDFLFKLNSAEKAGVAAWTVKAPPGGGLAFRVLLNLDAGK